MQSSVCRKAFLLCFSLAFAVLLISGAPRLIAASEDEMRHEIGVRSVQAYLCAGSTADTGPVRVEQEGNHRHAQKRDDALFRVSAGMFEFCVSNTDANGNVLLGTNYMRSVYQVFALGDGFV